MGEPGVGDSLTDTGEELDYEVIVFVVIFKGR